MTDTELIIDYLLKQIEVEAFYDEADPVLIADIAEQLNIAYVDYYETDSSASLIVKIKADKQAFYDSGKPRSNEYVIRSHTRPIGGEGVFRAFPPKDTPWTEEQRKGALALVSILSMNKAKIKVTDRLRYMAFHDVTSGLKNMISGKQTIIKAIESGRATDYASMFLNLRSMNEINSTFGFETGTMLMFRYAEMFDGLMEEDEAFWRLGGDNFCAIVRKDDLPKIE